jgi:hypothetical protein
MKADQTAKKNRGRDHPKDEAMNVDRLCVLLVGEKEA